ncbi:MAG: DUF4197 domain-containing protein [Gammaproteobacteria bacterium]|nr:DUF4197 domain-containing protein [Gammaproteobacteria bacterium]MBU1602304.1 DUF4197 domain-containing protein [Gammaproteobacteria bacterium]MBU2433110.1 DUF4197 domain-containing protein [Gammaproteobacteria bacterium]MBU2451024.1 DUF4197 domain-containing protein [Gammaproteobacteria bacterium]
MRGLKHSVFALFFGLTVGFAQAGALDAISSGDASAGVKAALAKGADYAVASLGKSGGFLGNDKVKIKLPGYLEQADSALRMFGMGKQADELIETMNHAAENAVAEAKPILTQSIKKMSIKDAKDILTGGEDSVTQYFKRTSTDQLTARFMPIVKKETQKLKLADQYNKFAGKAASAGLIDKQNADVDSYVTQKAMDGLFLMIAEEEKKLRSNPVEAGSALLSKVFGAL